jgi:hypothetical protein
MQLPHQRSTHALVGRSRFGGGCFSTMVSWRVSAGLVSKSPIVVARIKYKNVCGTYRYTCFCTHLIILCMRGIMSSMHVRLCSEGAKGQIIYCRVGRVLDLDWLDLYTVLSTCIDSTGSLGFTIPVRSTQ